MAYRHDDCKHQRQVNLDGDPLPCAWPGCPAGFVGPTYRTARMTLNQGSYFLLKDSCGFGMGPQVDIQLWKREQMQELNPAASHALPWEDRYRHWYFWRLMP
jgi:hypothetical protein